MSLHFLYIALGSAFELAIQVDLAISLNFLHAAEGSSLADRADHVQRMLNRLTGSMRRKLARGSQGNASERQVGATGRSGR